MWCGSYLPQAQRATAFHFLISNRFGFFDDEEAADDDEGGGRATPLGPSPAVIIGTSDSRVAMTAFENSRSRVSL